MVEETTSSTIAILLDEARRKHDLSERQLAEELGVASTTVGRALRGEPVDLATIQKIADWLGVETASLLNSEGVGPDALAAQLSALIEAEPKLAEVFEEAMRRVRTGKMDPSVVRDLIAYAAYRFQLNE